MRCIGSHIVINGSPPYVPVLARCSSDRATRTSGPRPSTHSVTFSSPPLSTRQPASGRTGDATTVFPSCVSNTVTAGADRAADDALGVPVLGSSAPVLDTSARWSTELCRPPGWRAGRGWSWRRLRLAGIGGGGGGQVGYNNEVPGLSSGG